MNIGGCRPGDSDIYVQPVQVGLFYSSFILVAIWLSVVFIGHMLKWPVLAVPTS